MSSNQSALFPSYSRHPKPPKSSNLKKDPTTQSKRFSRSLLFFFLYAHSEPIAPRKTGASGGIIKGKFCFRSAPFGRRRSTRNKPLRLRIMRLLSIALRRGESSEGGVKICEEGKEKKRNGSNRACDSLEEKILRTWISRTVIG